MNAPINTDPQLSKVRKLLAQAKDQAGTAEGRAFEERALELIIKYGIDEAVARQDATDAPEIAAERSDISFQGKYQDMQMRLLYSIAKALHCDGVMVRRYDSVTRRYSTALALFGLPNHLIRVSALFSALLPVMLKKAAMAKPDYYADSGKLRIYRRSFMIGFGVEINERLVAIERAMLPDDGNSSTALVLQSDAQKAKLAQREAFPSQREVKTSNRISGEGYHRGQTTARAQSLGTGGGSAVGNSGSTRQLR